MKLFINKLKKENLTIRLANLSEIDKAFMFLKDAAIWLKDKKIDYWQNWINPPDIHKQWISEGFDANEFYFVELDNQVIAMFRLQWTDELFWGVQENNAGYIHSFTIDRAFGGQDIGKHILLLIEDMCIKKNKTYLRLDCGVHIQKLSNYYENAGFTSTGEITLHGERLRLYEKTLINNQE